MRFRKLAADYDPTDRDAAYATVKRLQSAGEVVTGLLFVEEDAGDTHALNGTVERSLYDYPYEQLCPGSAALEALMNELAQAVAEGLRWELSVDVDDLEFGFSFVQSGEVETMLRAGRASERLRAYRNSAADSEFGRLEKIGQPRVILSRLPRIYRSR